MRCCPRCWPPAESRWPLQGRRHRRDQGRHHARHHRRPRGRGGAARGAERRRSGRPGDRGGGGGGWAHARDRRAASFSSIRSTARAPSSAIAPNSRSTSGLIEDGSPVFGIIYAPALSLLYATLDREHAVEATIAPGDAATLDGLELKPLHGREPDLNALVAFASRSHAAESDGCLPEALRDCGETQGELVAEVLSDRARRGRPLCAARADQRVGYRRRTGDPRRRRWQRDDASTASRSLTARRDARFANPQFVAWGAQPLLGAKPRQIRHNRATPVSRIGHTFVTLCVEGFANCRHLADRPRSAAATQWIAPCRSPSGYAGPIVYLGAPRPRLPALAIAHARAARTTPINPRSG